MRVPADNAGITIKTGTAATAYRRRSDRPAGNRAGFPPAGHPSGEGLKTSTVSGEFVTISVTSWVDGNTLAEKHALRHAVEAHRPRSPARDAVDKLVTDANRAAKAPPRPVLAGRQPAKFGMKANSAYVPLTQGYEAVA